MKTKLLFAVAGFIAVLFPAAVFADALAASDVTIVRPQDDGEMMVFSSGMRMVLAEVTFGDGSDTYPTGGVPLPVIGNFGFRYAILFGVTDADNSSSGYVYEYDEGNNKLLIYTQGVTTGSTAAAGGVIVNRYTDLTFAASAGTGYDTIATAGGDFTTDRFVSGMTMEIEGAATGLANNGIQAVIQAVTASTISIPDGTLTSAGPTTAVLAGFEIGAFAEDHTGAETVARFFGTAVDSTYDFGPLKELPATATPAATTVRILFVGR